MSDPIESRLIQLVAEVSRVDRSQITLNSRFIEDLESNSLDVVELICLLEAEFNVRVKESDIASIRTVGDVFHVLRTKS